MGRRSLPQVVIPVPCRVDWNLMTRIDRAGRARFCEKCERLVYDSKALTRDQLADLIATHEGRRLPCVRLHRRPDGTIVTKDCFEPVVRAGRFLLLKVGLAATVFWAAVAASWSWTRRPASSVIESDENPPAQSRRLPFTVKPPANQVPPIKRKSRSLGLRIARVSSVTAGAMVLKD